MYTSNASSPFQIILLVTDYMSHDEYVLRRVTVPLQLLINFNIWCNRAKNIRILGNVHNAFNLWQQKKLEELTKYHSCINII